jgi:ureidoglycolate lyase
MEVVPQPLTPEAFAPFGDVIDVPDAAGRTYYEEALGNLRPDARPSLSLSLKAETPDRPLRAELLERHEFSSQTFVPIDVGRWLIVVAPHAKAGGPDVGGLKAFIATGKQGVTIAPTPGITG